MEYRWSIYGGKAVKLRNFLQRKPMFLEVKNQDREKRKIPPRQGILLDSMDFSIDYKLHEGKTNQRWPL